MKIMDRLKSAFEEHKPKPVVNTLDSLLAAERITRPEYEVFILFTTNDLGKAYLSRNIEQTFMDQAPPELFTGEMLAYSEGRRSMLRDIKHTIEKVNQLLRGDYDNDN